MALGLVKESQKKRRERERKEGKEEEERRREVHCHKGWSLPKLVITQPFPVPTLQVSPFGLLSLRLALTSLPLMRPYPWGRQTFLFSL